MESVFYGIENKKIMKTKEEKLKKATRRTLNINEGSPLHDAVMKAMDEYAQQQVKNCSIPAVVGRSEQLKCEHKGRRTATELVEYCEDCKKTLFHP